jgi:hypothetical protein
VTVYSLQLNTDDDQALLDTIVIEEPTDTSTRTPSSPISGQSTFTSQSRSSAEFQFFSSILPLQFREAYQSVVNIRHTRLRRLQTSLAYDDIAAYCLQRTQQLTDDRQRLVQQLLREQSRVIETIQQHVDNQAGSHRATDSRLERNSSPDRTTDSYTPRTLIRQPTASVGKRENVVCV